MNCCECLTIQVLDSITGMPEHFLQSGRLYVDLPRDFALQLSKSLAELSELDEIKSEAAIEFFLPHTPKNKIIGAFVRNHNRIGNKYLPINVLVKEGSVNHHTFSELVFVGSSDTGKTFSVKLQRGAVHWLDGAAAKYLNTINIGNFEFTATNLIDNWTNNAEYNDGDQGVYFPVCHYGGWFSIKAILVEDFRPWVHVLSVLQKGFCELGWNFRSPWLETSVGRRMGSYVLDSEYGTTPGALEAAKFRATAANLDINGGNVTTEGYYTIIFTEDFDNSGGYNENNGVFSLAGVYDFTIMLNFEYGANGNGDASAFVQIIKQDLSGTNTVLNGYSLAGNITSQESISITAENVTVVAGESVFVLVTINENAYIAGLSGQFYNTPKKVIPTRGAIIRIQDYIDPDYTLLDFLKGVAHLGNCKFVTDYVNKTLWMYTPHDAEWYNEGVDGFCLNTGEDITELIVADSEEIVIEKSQQARFVQLQFKDSSDGYVDKNKLEESDPLYMKYIDLGSEFLSEETIENNPFFEPTVNAVIDKFPAIAPETNTRNIDIPHLWDNTEDKISYDIKPRLVYFQGYFTQLYGNAPGETRKWKFEDSTYQNLPWAYQKTDIEYYKDGSDNVYQPSVQLVYGENDNDFYNLGWRRELLTKKFANRSGFQMLINAKRYRATDFRSLYRVYYNGRTFFARMQEIDNYSTCSTAPAQIVLRPEPFIGDVCTDIISVDPNTCNNQPRIDLTVNVSGDYMSALPDNSGINSGISSDTWDYSVNDGASWSSYTSGDQISGYEEIIFRREVAFTDGCPTKVVSRTGSFASVCNNNPGITLDYNEGTNTITAVGSGSFNSSINTDTFEVSTDGGAFAAYTAGADVSNFDTVTFRRTTTYTNSCPQTIVTATYTVQGEPCQNSPVITFTEALPGACVYHLGISGVNSTVSFVSYQISDNGGTSWRHHDGSPIRRTGNTKVRAFIYFSDGCPTAVVEQVCP